MFSPLVLENGVQFAYVDSGAPSSSVYTTIFAIHGIQFTSPIFRKVAAVSRDRGVRFVALNRRGYSGSTPFSDAERALVVSGSDSDKNQWLQDRGIEILMFIDNFIQSKKLRPITAGGGVALLGWSLGTSFTAAALAHASALPSSVQERLGLYLRAHIIQEPPPVAFGLPSPEPFSFTAVLPTASQIPFYTRWLTSYFKHGDLSTRDPHILEYAVPALFRVPTIWNISSVEIENILDETPIDIPFISSLTSQNLEAYKRAVLSPDIRVLFPNLKTWMFVGDSTLSIFISTLWYIQDDDKAHGGNNIQYKVIPGANHFVHWDDPEATVDAYLEFIVVV